MSEACIEINISSVQHRICLKSEAGGYRLFDNNQSIAFLSSAEQFKLNFYQNTIAYFMAHEDNKCTVRLANKAVIGGDNRWIPKNGNPLLSV